MKPVFYSVIRPRLGAFRQNICVEQEAHRSIFRGSSLTRSITSPEPRRGEFQRNSAKVPLRFVLRSHSAAETTTTAFLPWRVMVWGPEDSACSMSSLKWDFASATVHAVRGVVVRVIGTPSLK